MIRSNMIFKNGIIYKDKILQPSDVLVEDGKIINVGYNLDFDVENTEVIDCTGKYILPGFSDVHVHFREPGYEYKETIKTGSMAAISGGYSNVCTMPNLNPVPDSLEHLNIQLEKINEDSVVNIHPFGSITKDEKGLEVSNIEDMAAYVIGYSDDGFGIENDEIMYEAMERAAKVGKPIAGHCEVKSITGNGIINNGTYSKMHNLLGISNSSEYLEVERNIEIAKKTGCHFHVCHASTSETIALVREAKEGGLNITCETAPQYLLLSEMDMKDDGRYRFQPPLRSLRDRMALLDALIDGTIDVIATDHAPHSYEEKSKGIRGSLNGIVGLECAFPMLYTYLVKQKIIDLKRLLQFLTDNPKALFGVGSEISVGAPAEFSIWDLDEVTKINAEEFESKGKFTPFDGKDVYGVRKLTLMRRNRYDNKKKLATN